MLGIHYRFDGVQGLTLGETITIRTLHLVRTLLRYRSSAVQCFWSANSSLWEGIPRTSYIFFPSRRFWYRSVRCALQAYYYCRSPPAFCGRSLDKYATNSRQLSSTSARSVYETIPYHRNFDDYPIIFWLRSWWLSPRKPPLNFAYSPARSSNFSRTARSPSMEVYVPERSTLACQIAEIAFEHKIGC